MNIRLRVFRIGECDPAPLFSLEAGPSEERIAGGVVKKEFAEGEKTRYKFFEKLLRAVKFLPDPRTSHNAPTRHWLGWSC